MNDEVKAQIEAFKAEGLQSQKVRLDAIHAQEKLVKNEDYLAFATAYRDVQKAIKSVYRNNPRIVDATTTLKNAQGNLDAVKAKECPETYKQEKYCREVKRAVLSLLVKGEVLEVAGVKVETVELGFEMITKGAVITVSATA